MIRLLVVKGEKGYYRFGGEVPEQVAVHRALVFPLEMEGDAWKALKQVRQTGVAARLVRLTITEEEYGRGGEGDAAGAQIMR